MLRSPKDRLQNGTSKKFSFLGRFPDLTRAPLISPAEMGLNGGGSGIRTHETLTSLHAFQASAFNHSAIPPHVVWNGAHYTQHRLQRNTLGAGTPAAHREPPALTCGRQSHIGVTQSLDTSLIMTAQHLLKLLALLSLVLTIAAITLWWTTGETPSPWLVRASLTSFALALLTGLIGQDTRPRVMMRFLAALFAIISAIAFAADFSHTGPDGESFKLTSLMTHLNERTPSLVASSKATVTRTLGDAAWDPMLTSVLSLPATVIFAGLAAAFGFAGRPRRRVRIFVN